MSKQQVIHVAAGGQVYLITDKSSKWYFEYHAYLGPLTVNKHGEPTEPPSDKSYFWEAVSLWRKQGNCIGPTGVCIWTRTKECHDQAN